MRISIPKKIKIGGITYKVIITDTWPGRSDEDARRFYDVELGNTIYIASHLSQEAKEISFIHEAFHCMNSTMNHEFLDSFAEQTYAFLKEL